MSTTDHLRSAIESVCNATSALRGKAVPLATTQQALEQTTDLLYWIDDMIMGLYCGIATSGWRLAGESASDERAYEKFLEHLVAVADVIQQTRKPLTYSRKAMRTAADAISELRTHHTALTARTGTPPTA